MNPTLTPTTPPNAATAPVNQAFTPTNPQQAAALSSVNAAFSTPPTTPPTISANGLIQTPPNPVQPPPATTTPPNTAIPSIDQLIADYSNPSSAESAAQGNVNDLTSRITSLLTKQGTEAQTTQNLNQSMGVNDLQTQLNELNKQMTDIASQRDQAKIAAESQAAPQFIINGDQQRLDHEASIKLLGLSAAATALQGNLSLAQQRVQQAVDLEFKPIQSQIESYKLLLDNSRSDMTKAQQDKADALKIQLDERNRLLTQQQTDKTDVYKIMLAAAQNGAPNTVLNGILASKNAGDATAAAGQYNQNPQDVALKNLQLEKARQDLASGGKNLNNLATQLTAARGADGYTDPNLYAQLRATSGVSPTEFDNRFGYLVNPASRERLGLGTQKENTPFGSPSATDLSAVFTLIGQHPDASASIDQQKLQTDPQYFYWVKSQLENL